MVISTAKKTQDYIKMQETAKSAISSDQEKPEDSKMDTEIFVKNAKNILKQSLAGDVKMKQKKSDTQETIHKFSCLLFFGCTCGVGRK